jgi:hypothetical protein
MEDAARAHVGQRERQEGKELHKLQPLHQQAAAEDCSAYTLQRKRHTDISVHEHGYIVNGTDVQQVPCKCMMLAWRQSVVCLSSSTVEVPLVSTKVAQLLV